MKKHKQKRGQQQIEIKMKREISTKQNPGNKLQNKKNEKQNPKTKYLIENKNKMKDNKKYKT